MAPASALAPRPQAVLAMLLTRPNRAVSRADLIAGLWGSAPPRLAGNSLARFIADLRRGLGELGERVVTGAGGYRIAVVDAELDWARARLGWLRAQAIESMHPEEALRLTTTMLASFAEWPSPALVSLHHTEMLLRQQEEFLLAVTQCNARLRLRLGRFDGLVIDLLRAVDRHPYHENIWGQLMEALARTGRKTEASRTYRQLGESLAEIGLEPTAALRALNDSIVRQDADVAAG